MQKRLVTEFEVFKLVRDLNNDNYMFESTYNVFKTKEKALEWILESSEPDEHDSSYTVLETHKLSYY